MLCYTTRSGHTRATSRCRGRYNKTLILWIRAKHLQYSTHILVTTSAPHVRNRRTNGSRAINNPLQYGKYKLPTDMHHRQSYSGTRLPPTFSNSKADITPLSIQVHKKYLYKISSRKSPQTSIKNMFPTQMYFNHATSFPTKPKR